MINSTRENSDQNPDYEGNKSVDFFGGSHANHVWNHRRRDHPLEKICTDIWTMYSLAMLETAQNGINKQLMHVAE